MLPSVMGVLNVTPDSFSDGGRFLDPERAVEHGLAMLAAGADVIDVGGESTRPGAEPVGEDEELRRVLPVVAGLAGSGRVSIDTRSARVAEAAVEAGASLINDVSASLHDVAAACGVGWVAMHLQGEPGTMQDDPRYDDVVGEVRDYLVERAERAVAAGVDEVWIDPGIGFGKRLEHNLALLAALDVLVATGFPVVVGTSRKHTLGRLLAASDARVAQPPLPGVPPAPPTEQAVPVEDRLEGSVAMAAWSFVQGAKMVRVHDVAPAVQAARLWSVEVPACR